MGIRIVGVVVLCLMLLPGAWAGPPFVTDDPEPVELGHWEVYISSMILRDASGITGTLPHVEVNYGAASNLQAHIILPYSFNQPNMGNTKYRFAQETDQSPMIGVFPLIKVPTGDASEGLGSGRFQFFLPVWLQKSWGSWTTYGGGGYFINPGPGNRDYWLFGWEIQKDLNERLTLGGELFGTTPMTVDASGEVNFNVGGQYNFDAGHHLLFSVGSGIQGDVRFMSYVGYQWTIGK